MIYVVATLDIKPEHRDAFIRAAQLCIAETVREKGCISYELHSNVFEQNRFVVVERWESQEHLDAHLQAAHLQPFRETLAMARTVPQVVEIITPAKVFRR